MKTAPGQAFKGDLLSEATQDVGYCQASGEIIGEKVGSGGGQSRLLAHHPLSSFDTLSNINLLVQLSRGE